MIPYKNNNNPRIIMNILTIVTILSVIFNIIDLFSRSLLNLYINFNSIG